MQNVGALTFRQLNNGPLYSLLKGIPTWRE